MHLLLFLAWTVPAVVFPVSANVPELEKHLYENSALASPSGKSLHKSESTPLDTSRNPLLKGWIKEETRKLKKQLHHENQLRALEHSPSAGSDLPGERKDLLHQSPELLAKLEASEQENSQMQSKYPLPKSKSMTKRDSWSGHLKRRGLGSDNDPHEQPTRKSRERFHSEGDEGNEGSSEFSSSRTGTEVNSEPKQQSRQSPAGSNIGGKEKQKSYHYKPKQVYPPGFPVKGPPPGFSPRPESQSSRFARTGPPGFTKHPESQSSQFTQMDIDQPPISKSRQGHPDGHGTKIGLSSQGSGKTSVYSTQNQKHPLFRAIQEKSNKPLEMPAPVTHPSSANSNKDHHNSQKEIDNSLDKKLSVAFGQQPKSPTGQGMQEGTSGLLEKQRSRSEMGSQQHGKHIQRAQKDSEAPVNNPQKQQGSQSILSGMVAKQKSHSDQNFRDFFPGRLQDLRSQSFSHRPLNSQRLEMSFGEMRERLQRMGLAGHGQQGLFSDNDVLSLNKPDAEKLLRRPPSRI